MRRGDTGPFPGESLLNRPQVTRPVSPKEACESDRDWRSTLAKVKGAR